MSRAFSSSPGCSHYKEPGGRRGWCLAPTSLSRCSLGPSPASPWRPASSLLPLLILLSLSDSTDSLEGSLSRVLSALCGSPQRAPSPRGHTPAPFPPCLPPTPAHSKLAWPVHRFYCKNVKINYICHHRQYVHTVCDSRSQQPDETRGPAEHRCSFHPRLATATVQRAWTCPLLASQGERGPLAGSAPEQRCKGGRG